MAWHAKEVLRSIYTIDDADTAAVFAALIGVDLQDDTCPPDVQCLGRTIVRWQDQIAACHQCRHTNEPTEAIDKRVKRRIRKNEPDQRSHPTPALRQPPQLVTPQPGTPLPKSKRRLFCRQRTRGSQVRIGSSLDSLEPCGCLVRTPVGG